MHKLIQEMIHAVNHSANNVISAGEYNNYSKKYDEIVEKACSEYEDAPPSKYYTDGYNLSLRMREYKQNHLLFLKNPLVEADNNLAERKAGIIKGKVNQAISMRSFEHLRAYCESLSVMDHLKCNNLQTLYESVKQIFARPKRMRIKTG